MDRSVLARKPMTELKDIASHLNMRGYQKLRKAELIDAIIDSATGDADASARAREEAARKVLPPGAREAEQQQLTEEPAESDGSDRNGRTRRRTSGAQDAEQRDAAAAAGRDEGGTGEDTGSRRSARTRGNGSSRDGGNRETGRDDGNRETGRAGGDRDGGNGSSRDGGNRDGGKRDSGKRDDGGQRERSDRDEEPSSEDVDAEGPDNDGDDDDNSTASRKRRSRRDRRKRNRDRGETENQQANEPGEVRAGVLDILPEGYGFLRTTGYLPGDRDVYVSQGQIRKHGLRRGDVVQGPVRQQRSNEKVPALHHVQKVNGGELEANRVPERPEFEELVPVYPSERLPLETDRGSVAMRMIDLLSPIGKGQRALLSAPPAAGRTDVIINIGQAIADNNPEAHLMVLLIDERPEDVTEVERAIPGEVIASTFDRPLEDHAQVAELAVERAKRLVELGHDVVMIVDSLTRLARAHAAAHGSGATHTGEMPSLFPTKRFFGAARNIEDGGSLTMVGATLVEDGSAVDDRIHAELAAAANAVIALDGHVPPHLRPAISVAASGTRREELLVEDEDLQAIWAVRSRLAQLEPSVATRTIVEEVAATADNDQFLRRSRSNGSA